MNDVVARAPEPTEGSTRKHRMRLLLGALGLAAIGAACHGGPHPPPPPPPAPAITSISPTAGPIAGGNTVTINGSNFTGTTQVKFGSLNAPGFTVVNSTKITVPAPAAPGAVVVSIRVTRSSGTSPNTANDDYEYAPVPTITGLDPVFDDEAGGASVVITGTGFDGPRFNTTSVKFGATNATSFTVNSPTQITATAPAGTGDVQVSVTTPGGVSANTAADDFHYIPPPTVTGLAPTNGPATGGTTVVISGTGFTSPYFTAAAVSVTFGGNDADFTVVNDTTINATAPVATAPCCGSAREVRVTTPGGTSADNGSNDNYTYNPNPVTISSISPTNGPADGGTDVTITGTGFTAADAVVFGGDAATSFTVNSDTSITATSPQDSGGSNKVDVSVSGPGGTNPNTSLDDFTYAPVVTGLSPDTGSGNGLNQVVITGDNFTGATGVSFGANPATGVSVDNDDQITATAPAGTGTVDVTVTTPAGTSPTAGTANDYDYIVVPAVTGLDPTAGPTTSGTIVTVTGTGFNGATSVTFGGTPAMAFTVDSDTQVTATAPAHAAGTVSVIVTTPGGSSPNTAADDYSYTAAPTVTMLTPANGPSAGGNSVTVTGTGFSGAGFSDSDVTVKFGGVDATSFTVLNATTISATAPAAVAPCCGAVRDVIVTTPGGTSANTAADDYTYNPGTVAITGLNPSSGPTVGGTEVTITGTGFTATSGAGGVTFGGTGVLNNAMSYTVDSDTQITATSPAHLPGSVRVRVNAPGGTSPDTPADDFTYVPAPAVTGLNPTVGPEAGGTSVVITGFNFNTVSGPAGVKFGANNATAYTVNSNTQITATAPAGTGTVSVIVTNTSGPSNNTPDDDYRYAPVPAVTSLSPANGPAGGETEVVITGSGFTGATGAAAVKFGGTNALSYTVDNDGQITATSPAGTSKVDVTVTTPGGTSSTAGTGNDYTYAPTITGLSPSNGPCAGGTTVVITGTGFTGATSVKFGSETASVFTVNNDGQITVTSPNGPPGLVDVFVTTAAGTNANTASDNFLYTGTC